MKSLMNHSYEIIVFAPMSPLMSCGSRNGAAFLLNYVKGCDNGTTKLYD
jgi:hypothetical protein